MDAALAVITQPLTTFVACGLPDPAATERYGDRITFTIVEVGSHHFLIEALEDTAPLLVASRF